MAKKLTDCARRAGERISDFRGIKVIEKQNTGSIKGGMIYLKHQELSTVSEDTVIAEIDDLKLFVEKRFRDIEHKLSNMEKEIHQIKSRMD